MSPTLTIHPECRLQWRLLEEYDNSNNKNSTITRKVKMTKSSTINGKDYTKNVQDLSKETAEKTNVNVEASASWGPVSASVSAGYEVSTDVKSFVSSTVEVSREETKKTESEVEETYSIGPGDKLYLYQLVFSGNGLVFETGTTAAVSSKKTAADDTAILLDVVTKPTDFITDIDVVYGSQPSDAPSERVRDFNHVSDDINKGFKGDYVWLVPVYTQNTEKAATSFDLVVQDSAVSGRKDLAKGAGGQYRYLIPVRDKRESKKITKLSLIRQDEKGSAVQLRSEVAQKLGGHWIGAEDDINKDRKGSYLYLVAQQY